MVEAAVCCPQCGSKSLYNDGFRYLSDGTALQRRLCRECAYRFSENRLKLPLQKTSKQPLNTHNRVVSSSQICASQKEAKNLTAATETKTVAGDTERKLQKHIDLLPEEMRGLIIKYMAYLEREGYSPDITYPDILTHLVMDGANLNDPESIKAAIAQQRKQNGEPWSNSMKMLATCAYDGFAQMQGIAWKRPNYHQNEATIPVPDEKDLDMLISAASKRMAAFLQCLKETYADPSEILRCEWIDLKDQVLSINHPVKFHYPGKYTLSTRLTAMLNALPRKNKRIFPVTYKCAYKCLEYLRRKAANYFQNPALLQITFKSFRHWGGSMLAYYSNGNVPLIAKVLRHKQWKSTQKYVHTIAFKEEDFDVTTATTSEEVLELGKAGWTKYDEATFNGVNMHFYRRPKRFGSLKTIDNKSTVGAISNYNS